ncbi:dihydrolipoyl dehydrogenase family protein [Rhabdothermincola salaria]|uniref:dihydrolipoyl dehydrogenase family protein n=1 Tax=Rhabdothermincola salaria TaxID=2903142 RepID=UPI001E4209F0|nr:FAD-dependent oxidoreductase [Rhabdothermincola salaria]MCD9623356.1 FAD-dependent oxidoreductase [Rhabdothermincola salaria]
MAKRFVIIGGGPAGNTAATHAARLGAEVTMIEKDVVGGAAHLWDCIPSKAMIATGGALARLSKAEGMGLRNVSAELDFDALAERIRSIEERLETSGVELLESQGVRMVEGAGRLVGPNQVVAETAAGPLEIEADTVVLSTGSRPRIPDWASIDGTRVLTTRDAYPPPQLPEHLVVVGSGVTGVEFVHMFSSFGCQVTLIVSRQQVLPNKDPEVAAALEDDFIARGVRLYKGARAVGIDTDDDGVTVQCDDGRKAQGSHVLLAIGSVPNSETLGLDAAGVEQRDGYVVVNHNCQSSVPNIYAAGDLSGKLPLSSVASMQGRKIAEHAMGLHGGAHRHLDYDKAASAIFTVPEIADVGLAEADAFAEGRKIRVTKVPFSANAKALIENDPRGFVKIISDPATGVILGGSIVGRRAAELISVIALAVTAGLRVHDIYESLLVHPTLAEALSDAAE